MLALRFVCVVALVVSGHVAPALATQASSPATTWFNRYRTGNRPEMVAAIAAIADADIDVVLRDVRRRAAEWVRQGRSTDRARLDVATFLLEVAGARLETDWRAVRDIVEMACRLIEPVAADVDGVKQWHLAALALAQGAADTALLLSHGTEEKVPAFDHLAHSARKFPAEPRFQLADVVVRGMGRSDLSPPRDLTAHTDYELQQMPGVGRSEVPLRQARVDTLRRMTLLTATDAIADEAHLRSGYLAFALYDDGAAGAHLTQALARTDDVFVRYNAEIVLAMMHARAGARVEAEAALRRALGAVPFAQSAVGLLSAELFLSDRESEAQELVGASFARRGRPTDPWRLFGYGDFRRWPGLILGLRQQVSR